MDNSLLNKKRKINVLIISYIAIWFVVIFWGIGPLVSVYLYNYFSPVIYTFLCSSVSLISLIILCLPNLKKLSKVYLKVGIPTGLCTAIANLLQKIGLKYTTPTNYAFLENLSIIVIPIIVFIVVKKKPNFITLISICLCIISAIILSGSSLFSSGKVNIGDLLCAIAGLLYGANIALTGIYAKEISPLLYVLVQTAVRCVFNFISLLILSNISFGNNVVEPIMAIWNIKALIILIIFTTISNTLCWTLRTFALKHINATTVGIIMPCSSIVSTILSIIFRIDNLTILIVVGSIIGIISAWLPSISDIMVAKKHTKLQKKHNTL